METHSRILARMILWTERPGKLQSMESQRLKRLSARTHARARAHNTHTHTHTHTHTATKSELLLPFGAL